MTRNQYIPDWTEDQITQEYLDQDYSMEEENFESFRIAIERRERNAKNNRN